MDPGRRKEKDCQRWKLQGPALVFGRHGCLLEHSWEPASSKGTRMCQRVGDVVYTSMQPPAHAVTLHTLRRRGETVLEGTTCSRERFGALYSASPEQQGEQSKRFKFFGPRCVSWCFPHSGGSSALNGGLMGQ